MRKNTDPLPLDYFYCHLGVMFFNPFHKLSSYFSRTAKYSVSNSGKLQFFKIVNSGDPRYNIPDCLGASIITSSTEDLVGIFKKIGIEFDFKLNKNVAFFTTIKQTELGISQYDGFLNFYVIGNPKITDETIENSLNVDSYLASLSLPKIDKIHLFDEIRQQI